MDGISSVSGLSPQPPGSKWHYLKGNSRVETPRHLFFYDCETRESEIFLRGGESAKRLDLWFGWAAYLRARSRGVWCEPRWFRFESASAFWNILKKLHAPKTALYTFAHNAGFDLRCVDAFRFIPRLYPALKLCCLDAPPLIIDCRKDTRRLICLDTLNWWKTSLSELGKRIGLCKLETPDLSAPRALWDAYCRRDVEVIMETVKRWIDFLLREDMGSFKQTLASQALQAYRHRFMPCKILLDRDPVGLKLSRAAYHGGRVECFRLGELPSPIHYLDVNAMYPAVMARNEYPVRFCFSRGPTTLAHLEFIVKKFAVIASVRIKTDNPAYPVIRDGRLLFPVGEFDAVLTTPELIRALSRGEILSVSEMAVWHSDRIFEMFVSELWGKRRAANHHNDPVNSWLFKIMANSLYGKFGQHGYREIDLGPCDPSETLVSDYLNVDSGERGQVRHVFGRKILSVKSGEARNAFPAIAAHVTAYARLELWRLIEAAGAGEVFYCDTDSLFVSHRGFVCLREEIDNDALGKLKKVAAYERVVLYGPKDYQAGSQRILKGVRANAQEISPAVYRQEMFVGLRGALRLGVVDAPIIRMVEKTLAREYKKGEVSVTGEVSSYRIAAES